jgi:acyl-coenzyme A synthetase/AMP-(fatty) acid ligase
MNVTDPILAIARTSPDRLALIRPHGESTTYATLARRIEDCARRAVALGLLPGQLIGLRITAPNDGGLGLVTALGLARAGIGTADVSLPGRHLAAFVRRPGVAAPRDVRQIEIEEFWSGDPGADLRPTEDDADRPFRIFGTSGSTGMPRFCAQTHGIMAARIAATGYPLIGTSWHPVVLCAMPADGSRGLLTVLATLSAGGTFMLNEGALDNIVATVMARDVTTIVTAPSTLARFVEQTPPGLGPLASLRAVAVTGSYLPETLAELARSRLCPDIFVSFGASETSGVAAGRYDEIRAIPLAVGYLRPGAEVQAVSAEHVPLPPGTQGILRYRTPHTIQGYFDDPAATEAAFRDGWFYSGDIGTVTMDGVLLVAGRKDELINSGGTKVSPRLIESVLRGFPAIVDAAVFPVRDRYGVERPWAAIVATGAIDARQLDAHCRPTLGPAAPRYFLQIDRLPRNENGKVLSQTLIELAERQQQAMQAQGPA